MPRIGYTILEHPADLGIEAFGGNLEEAFEQAALALMSVILDLSTVRPLASRNIEISGTDHGQLLVKWLTEVLYLYDGEGFAGCRFEIEQLTTGQLAGMIHGERFDEMKHTTRCDVKAVTYHQLQVSQANDGAMVRVYLDV